MTSKTDPTIIEPTAEKPGYIYTLAYRLDKTSRALAKKLHDLGFIYALYGALDGLSLSYSTLKYCFDVFLTNSSLASADAMHTWLLTPTGIAVAVTESVFIIVFSILANYFAQEDTDKLNRFKRFIVLVWPYLRDVMKGLKNAYKGVKTTLQVAGLIGSSDLRLFVLPLGLMLGLMSVLNRMWFLHMVSLRKDMMVDNAKTLAFIRAESLHKFQRSHYKIKKQETTTKIKAFLSASYSGVIDSLYLYMGLLSLSSLVWPALVVMTVFCVVYSISCVAVRIYEEYDNQRKLAITQAEIELELYSKEIQILFLSLQTLSEDMACNAKGIDTLANTEAVRFLSEKTTEKIRLFKEKKAHLQSLVTLSYFSGFLSGLKHGLYAYGALSSILFAIVTVLLLCSIACPPALLISIISTGMLLLVGFVVHSLVYTYQHRTKQEQKKDKPDDRLIEILAVINDIQQTTAFNNGDIKTIVGDEAKVDASPQFFFQQWFEVVRIFFSGICKGPKVVEFGLNPLQEADAIGNGYHETPFMLVISFFTSMTFAVVLSLRTLAKFFGRAGLTEVTVPVVAEEEALLVENHLALESDGEDLDATAVLSEQPSDGKKTVRESLVAVSPSLRPEPEIAPGSDTAKTGYSITSVSFFKPPFLGTPSSVPHPVAVMACG